MAKNAITSRQKQFVYHYLRGLPGPKAAHAAGYARSTAEHNAALLLRNPHVIYTITLLQQGTREHLMEIFLKAKKRACHTLDYDSYEPAANQASREMRGWFKILLATHPTVLYCPTWINPPKRKKTQSPNPSLQTPKLNQTQQNQNHNPLKISHNPPHPNKKIPPKKTNSRTAAPPTTFSSPHKNQPQPHPKSKS